MTTLEREIDKKKVEKSEPLLNFPAALLWLTVVGCVAVLATASIGCSRDSGDPSGGAQASDAAEAAVATGWTGASGASTAGLESGLVDAGEASTAAASGPYLVVLGIGQDAGIPQVGSWQHPGWEDRSRRRWVSSVGLVDPGTGQRWLFDATPDLRDQLYVLSRLPPSAAEAANGGLTGVFLTHAHIGHYTGLMFLGHESMGGNGIGVYAMPRFASFLEDNGPWSQLVRYENISLQRLEADQAVVLGDGLSVTPLVVPHRQEFSEVVGFRIDGPQRSALYLPDIDSWEDWDETGVALEDVLDSVDVAYLDATFFANGEIPGRDMSGFPHPFIKHTMARLEASGRSDLASKVRFIHLNHTNPAQYSDHDARAELEQAGFSVAEQGEVVALAGSS